MVVCTVWFTNILMMLLLWIRGKYLKKEKSKSLSDLKYISVF